jgi:N utilization substance protein B
MKRRGQHEPKRRARRRALQALYQWQMTGLEANDIIDQFLEEQDFSGVDVELFSKLVREVIELHKSLDEALQPYLDRPASQLDIMETVVLRIAAYDLLNSPDIPVQVVLDEAIELARRFGAEQGHSFVNAVLDKAARDWRKAELAENRFKPS